MNFDAFFKISYGLYVISSEHEGIKSGYVANTAFQVTSEPPQIAISCNKNNFTCHLIERSGQFSISILNQASKADIIGLFGYKSGTDINKFEKAEFIYSKASTPVLTQDCIAWFDCRVKQVVDTGSHLLFIGEIIENELLDKDAEPLTYAYYRDVKKGSAPKNAPTYIDKSKLKDHETKISPTSNKYVCLACGYIYDPAVGDVENGIKAGTSFEDLPDDWTCPTCGSLKSMFEALED